MRIYGLTGNIGSGKSTVARLLRDAGVPVVDADALAREVVLPGTEGLARIAERFPGVVAADGTLDRKALAARVFGDPAERAALNAIVHPLIARTSAERMSALEAAGTPFAVYEAALIVENRLHEGLDGLVVVTVPLDEQIRRVQTRDGATEAEARARIAAQLPQEQKAALATWRLENSGGLDALRAQVEALLKEWR